MQKKLGRYTVKELLGEGSFAWVYRALDEELGRHVALKILKSSWRSDPLAVARLNQEARTMAKLNHANIAMIYDVGESEGQVFLAQFLVDGETLADRLARLGAMPWPEILQILRQVASALDYAHSRGIIHRDIKPANILLDKNGQAYLGDFGLVRAVEGSHILSASASLVGTAHYIAPEIWDGQDATPAADMYSLSCVCFEMITGHLLFGGLSMMSILRQHLAGPAFPFTWPPGIPREIGTVLRRGLTENPIERISSAGEFVRELAALDNFFSWQYNGVGKPNKISIVSKILNKFTKR